MATSLGPTGFTKQPTAEYFLFAIATSDESWDQLWIFVDDPLQSMDPKWDTPAKRLGAFATEQDANEIQQKMRAVFKTKTTGQWQAFLATQPDIVYEKVQNYDEVRTDPQVLANNYI